MDPDPDPGGPKHVDPDPDSDQQHCAKHLVLLTVPHLEFLDHVVELPALCLLPVELMAQLLHFCPLILQL
jgi:hypothetical protein